MSKTISVKVMRSHDYCHFEIALGCTSDDANETLDTFLACADSLRKDAARLADKAVEQYKVAKQHAAKRLAVAEERRWLKQEVDEILKKSESDRTPNEVAKLKLLADAAYWRRRERSYDYEDDWDEDND